MTSGPAESVVAVTFAPRRDVLPNGLTVLYQANPLSPAVSISLRVAAGSSLETREMAGLANFTAASLKKGTRKRSKEQIGETLDTTGALLSTGAGRHTAGVGAKARAADLEEILELVAECAIMPSFPVTEIEKLRGDLLTAIREDADDTAQVASDHLRDLIYPADHPYSWRVRGTEESVGKPQQETLAEFHGNHYGPGRAALVVVGAVEHDAVVRAAEDAFGGWDGPATVSRREAAGLAASLPDIADAAGPAAIERAVATMPGKAQADIALGHPGIRRLDPDYYAAAVLNMILGRFAMGGRLGRSIREEQGMAYYAYSRIEASVGPGPFVVSAGVHPDNVDRAVDSIVDELESIAGAPVEEQELDDASSALIRSVPRRLDTNEGMASALHLIEQYELGMDYLDRYPEFFREVTVETIQTAAGRLLHPDRYGVAIAGHYPMEG